MLPATILAGADAIELLAVVEFHFLHVTGDPMMKLDGMTHLTASLSGAVLLASNELETERAVDYVLGDGFLFHSEVVLEERFELSTLGL